jgi:hypothetical protein
MEAFYRDERRFGVVGFTGRWSLREFSRLLKPILEAPKGRKRHLLLIDLSAVSNDYLTTLERYKLGLEAATLLTNVKRVSTLARVDQIDSERFGQTVARNQGLDVKVFSEPELALTWLLEARRFRNRVR